MSTRRIILAFGNINTHLVQHSLADILDTIKTALQRITASSKHTASEQPSPFFRLPLEMRQAIYEAAIFDDSDGGPNSDENMTPSTSASLVQTCRQVKIEAEPKRYQRPQSFSSQRKLFAWIDHSRHSNLERVRTLTLHLTDIDVSSVLVPNIFDPHEGVRPSDLYRHELAQLEDALRCLPNLASLTIIPPKKNHAMLSNFYRSFLVCIPTRCPKLMRLELHDTNDILAYAPTLNNIEEVVFTEVAHEDSHATECNGGHEGASTVVKVESDDFEAPPAQFTPSRRAMRRCRVTRVTTD
jgi:hypothetical protein